MIWADLVVVLVCILSGGSPGGYRIRHGGRSWPELFRVWPGTCSRPVSRGGAANRPLRGNVGGVIASGRRTGLDGSRWRKRCYAATPARSRWLAPLISYAFSFVSGTGHVSYSLLPIIAEVSRKVKERPERPLSISVIASGAAVTASPMSAATAGMVALLSKRPPIWIDRHTAHLHTVHTDRGAGRRSRS